ncbi:hypothetical protein M5K25_001797 [Dendrobium thyrsiflorum]|uniref:Uncharacterized protein n=1 Tax=Dendrobium thyrsiflorum TaxID=117978 RepID=A0ABD0W2I0_DENTH
MLIKRFEINIFTGEKISGCGEKMKALLVHQRSKAREIQLKAQCVILLSLSDKVLREVVVEDSTIEAWKKFGVALSKEIIDETKGLRKHMDEFNKILFYLKNVDRLEIKEEKSGDGLLVRGREEPRSIKIYQGQIDQRRKHPRNAFIVIKKGISCGTG